MYAHLLSSAGVRDDDRLFANENDESHFGGTITTPEISTKGRRSSAIGGTPFPRRDPTVATVDSLRDTAPSLNRALADLGYHSPLELLLPDATDLARTCDVLFSLLRDRQDDLAARESWADERRRLSADVAAVETKAERFRVSRDAEASCRNADANRADLHEETTSRRIETISTERDVARRDARAATQKLVKLEHDARRNELEMDRLKARLASVIDATKTPQARQNERDVHRGGVTIVTGAANHPAVAVSKPKINAKEHIPSPAVSLALHHSMMSAYEAKLRAFMHDSNDLRQMLKEHGVDPETGGVRGGAKKATGEALALGDGGLVTGKLQMSSTEMQVVEEQPLVTVASLDVYVPAENEPETESESVADAAFAFNLSALRDRLRDADETETPETQTRFVDEDMEDDDVRAAFCASAEAAVPTSPVEIALRWHAREHARLSKGAEGVTNASGFGVTSASTPTSLAASPSRRSRAALGETRLEWNLNPVGVVAKPKTPKLLRARATEASPEVSSSDGGDENDERGDGGSQRVSVSSEEGVEDAFRKRQQTEFEKTPRRAKYSAKAPAIFDPPPGIEPAPVAAVAPASPASPLDALLARHLGKTRSEVLQARGVPKERSAWLERRRRRANPFAETAE